MGLPSPQGQLEEQVAPPPDASEEPVVQTGYSDKLKQSIQQVLDLQKESIVKNNMSKVFHRMGPTVPDA